MQYDFIKMSEEAMRLEKTRSFTLGFSTCLSMGVAGYLLYLVFIG